MKRIGTIGWLVWNLALVCSAQQNKPLYDNNFQSALLDKLPEDLLVLDGGFAVKEEQGNKFLELPGAPLDTYTLLFGPTERDGVSACARFFGTARGRRSPSFTVGLNGAGGYRLQVSPGRRALELLRGDAPVKASTPYTWQSGKWTWLRIQVQKAGGSWKISGKVWPDGTAEPKAWSISTTADEELPAGRASVGGTPFAETPIRFDDLTVARVAGK